jgi:hypothetical protein
MVCTVQGVRPLVSLAQFDSPADVAQFVYQKLPNLPLENQYLRTDTKKQAIDSTLISRLVQYHTNVKGRSPLYRLDWKITLADYLGANDYLQPEKYPGNGFLKSSPMERDRTLIQALTLSQRNALIQALVNGFSRDKPAAEAAPPVSSPQPKASQAPAQPSPLPLPKGGSADLRKPAKPPSRPSGDAQYLLP